MPPRHIAAHAQMHVWHWDPIRHKVRGRRLDSDRHRAIGAHQLIASVEVRVAVLGIGVSHPAIDRTSYASRAETGDWTAEAKMISQKKHRNKSGIFKHIFFCFPHVLEWKSFHRSSPRSGQADVWIPRGFGLSRRPPRQMHRVLRSGGRQVTQHDFDVIPWACFVLGVENGWGIYRTGSRIKNRIVGEPYLDR